jgi:hypothetical protein
MTEPTPPLELDELDAVTADELRARAPHERLEATRAPMPYRQDFNPVIDTLESVPAKVVKAVAAFEAQLEDAHTATREEPTA